jgi:hypothetical protein
VHEPITTAICGIPFADRLAWEHVVLVRQVGAARIDQVDAGQVVLLGDLLRAQVLLDRHRIVSAALDGGVVTHDHALLAGHAADAGDDAGCGRGVVVHLERGQLGEFEEGRAGIEQHLHAVARQQLAARDMLGAGSFAAALGERGHPGAQVVDQGLHGRRVGFEILAARIEFALDVGHCRPLLVVLTPDSRRPDRTSGLRRPRRVRTQSGSLRAAGGRGRRS